MVIDYFVQVSLTTQIILSHNNNQTKIVTTANTINTRITTAGGSRIRLQNVPTYINSSASDNQLCDCFFVFQLRVSKGISEQQLVAPMRKAGDVFGSKPRMISNRPVLVLD